MNHFQSFIQSFIKLPFYWFQKFISLSMVLLLSWSFNPGLGLTQTVGPDGLFDSLDSINRSSGVSIEPYLEGVSQRISEFTLDNGMKFIVFENHQAPVVSFVTYADVGGVDEPMGKTGVAHFLEHLAFKGTTEIGTTNYKEEKKLLDRLDKIFSQLKAAQINGNEALVSRLQQEFNQTQTEASKYVKQNDLGKIVETEGGVGLNAATSADYTVYFYSFPSNKLELWMSLESERFLEPVFREFYQEKQVILEERRLRTDNSPIGTMLEQFLGTAFSTHPYQQPVIGYEEDIRNLTRDDVREFFETYYVPNNLTVAMAGDVNPTQVKELAEVYFGRFQPQNSAPKVTEVEPIQTAPREVTVEFPSQPWYLEGYHRPSISHSDYPVYELITAILSDGRTSRLYKSLVEEQQVALAARGISTFPGEKFPNLMLFYALTAPNHSVDEVATALDQEIERLKNEPVSEIDLERVKTQARASVLRSLDSNKGMAQLLVDYEVKTGSWRNLFEELNALSAVTAGDIQRVANQTFIPSNRTIGRLLPPSS